MHNDRLIQFKRQTKPFVVDIVDQLFLALKYRDEDNIDLLLATNPNFMAVINVVKKQRELISEYFNHKAHGMDIGHIINRFHLTPFIGKSCKLNIAINETMLGRSMSGLENNITPLMIAATHGDEDAVERLLASHADVMQTDSNGNTALLMAVNFSYTAIVIRLLNANAKCATQANHDGQTALILAAASMGKCDIVKLLLVADPNGIKQADHNGLTPLLYASRMTQTDSCSNAHLYWSESNVINEPAKTETIRLLLEANADANDMHGEENTVLQNAAQLGEIDDINLLLAHDADINRYTSSGKTAIMLAASRGKYETVAALISAKASIFKVDSESNTALRLAKGDTVKKILEEAEFSSKLIAIIAVAVLSTNRQDKHTFGALNNDIMHSLIMTLPQGDYFKNKNINSNNITLSFFSSPITAKQVKRSKSNYWGPIFQALQAIQVSHPMSLLW